MHTLWKSACGWGYRENCFTHNPYLGSIPLSLCYLYNFTASLLLYMMPIAMQNTLQPSQIQH